MRIPQHSPRTLPANNKPAKSITFCADAPRDDGCVLFAGGGSEPLTKAARADMLAKLRAGEMFELEIEAVTYIQRDTPNRNYVRFKPGILATFAKSFEGQPFLKDHNSYEMSARGGTIIASKLEHNEDGSKQIRMRLKLVKAWALEDALDGTLDRFSIGWSRAGATPECSICEASIYRCDHYPGMKDTSTGVVCQLVFTVADGTEVSGVNVPAVVGTKVESISQLAELDDPMLLVDILGLDAMGSVTNPEPDSMKNLPLMIAALGLAATATEDDVAQAVAANAAKLAIVEKAEADRLAAEKLAAAVAVETKKIADAARVESLISSLKASGKLLAQLDPKEAQLRAIAAASLDGFELTVAAMVGTAERVTPVGAPLPARTSDPSPTNAPGGKAMLQTNPVLAKMLDQVGITEAEFEKHGATARDMHEQRLAAQR